MGLIRNRPVGTGKIADHLYAVRTGPVNFFVYQDEEQAVCIDSGFGKRQILRGLQSLGIDPRRVTHLFLTHSDFDHASGLRVFPQAKIYLSLAEEPMITGMKARTFAYYNPAIPRPYRLLQDGEVVTVGAMRIRAIGTPGHTPGSMSYLLDGSILFVGDTFKLVAGQVHPLRRYINNDTEQQKESIRKLASLEGVRLACTAHSGYTERFDEAIRAWRVR
jgi:hydroxyacylglutathione hydrolase